MRGYFLLGIERRDLVAKRSRRRCGNCKKFCKDHPVAGLRIGACCVPLFVVRPLSSTTNGRRRNRQVVACSLTDTPFQAYDRHFDLCPACQQHERCDEGSRLWGLWLESEELVS